MYYVYILKSLKDNSFYIGSTKNLTQRLTQHNKGKSKYTKSRMPWKLIYLERYETHSEAFRRERQIKSGKKRDFIKKLIADDKIGTIPS